MLGRYCREEDGDWEIVGQVWRVCCGEWAENVGNEDGVCWVGGEIEGDAGWCCLAVVSENRVAIEYFEAERGEDVGDLG